MFPGNGLQLKRSWLQLDPSHSCRLFAYHYGSTKMPLNHTRHNSNYINLGHLLYDRAPMDTILLIELGKSDYYWESSTPTQDPKELV